MAPKQEQIRYDATAFKVELGKRIRQIRRESGLTLRQLIVGYGFHLTQIQRIEKGNGLAIPTLLRVAETFQIPVERLVAGLGLAGEEPTTSSDTQIRAKRKTIKKLKNA